MGSRFLNQGGADLSVLTEGTFELNVASIIDVSLAPNLPVRSSPTKVLTSGLIGVSDCSFVPLVNPYTGTISAQNFISKFDTVPININNYLTANDSNITALQAATQFITASLAPNTTTINSITSSPTIYTTDIKDSGTHAQSLHFISGTSINAITSLFEYNGIEVATTADLAAYLPLAGGLMLGAIDMGNNPITDITDAHISGSIIGSVKTTAANDIVSNTGAAVAGNVAIFSGATGKLISDTGASLSQYLPLSGGTMSGNINLNFNELTGVAAIRTSATNVIFGTSAVAAGGSLNGVMIGTSATIVGDRSISIGGASFCADADDVSIGFGATSNGKQSVLIGSGAVAASESTIIGYGSTDTSTTTGAVSIGHTNTTSVDRCIAIGRDNVANANAAFIIGNGQTNSTAHSLLLGNTGGNLVNIRCTGAICDLGTQVLPFQTLWLNTSLDAPAVPLNIGNSQATAVNIGTSGITTTALGVFTATIPSGAWYSNSAYNPSFSAGVARLIPPTASLLGLASQFTYAAGILTYTGARTRTFKISYNIDYVSGPNGSSMRFFNSTNGSVVLSSTQTQIFKQINATNNALGLTHAFSDITSLMTGDTIQLAATCSILTAAVSFTNVSCNVIGLMN
jgi:hypothetical protein